MAATTNPAKAGAAQGQNWRAGAAALAGRYGLPADLHPLQVRAVVALAGGPRSVAELAAACGKSAARGYRAFNSRGATRGSGVNLLSDLCRRGLAAKVQASRGGRSGRAAATYVLTGEAMARLESAA